jgi:hypothetical protein
MSAGVMEPGLAFVLGMVALALVLAAGKVRRRRRW